MDGMGGSRNEARYETVLNVFNYFKTTYPNYFL